MAESTKSTPVKRRRWLRRIWRGALWTLLVLVIFHRPLIHHGGAWAAKRIAKQEHLILDLKIGGNLWSNLKLEDVSIRDDGSGLGAIEILTLDQLAVEYDLGKLIGGDYKNAIRKIGLGKLHGVIVPQEKKTEKAKEPSKSVAEQFQALLKNLELPVGDIALGNITIEVKNTLKLEGFHLEVRKNAKGLLAWRNLIIPGGLETGLVNVYPELGKDEFKITNVRISDKLQLNRLHITAKSVTLPNGGLELEIAATDGRVNIRISPDQTPGQLKIVTVCEGVKIHELAGMFGSSIPQPLILETLNLDLTGKIENMESWVGNLSLQAVSNAPELSGNLSLNSTWNNGLMTLKEINADLAGATLGIQGTLQFSPTQPDIRNATGKLHYQLTASDLSKLPLKEPFSGRLQSSGSINLEKGFVQADATLDAGTLGFATNTVAAGKLSLSARRSMEHFENPLHSLTARLGMELSNIQIQGTQLDSGVLQADLADSKLSLQKLEFLRGQNHISAQGKLVFEEKKLSDSGNTIQLSINAPKLEELGYAVNGALLSGQVTANADIALADQKPNGSLRISTEALKLGTADTGDLQGDFLIKNSAVSTSNFVWSLPGAGDIGLSASITIPQQKDDPTNYEASLDVTLDDLQKLEPLLKVFHLQKRLAGKLQLDWKGKGALPRNHDGNFTLNGSGLVFDTTQIAAVDIAGGYSPGKFEASRFSVSADKATLGGVAIWEANRLKVNDLQIELDARRVLSGTLDLPLQLQGGEVLPASEVILASIKATDLDLPKLFQSFGKKPPVKGILNLTLDANGSLEKPHANLDLNISSLSSTDLQLDPAKLEIKGELTPEKLLTTLLITQKDIQPLQASLSLPLNILEVIKTPSVFDQLPLKGSAKLPATSLAILPRFVPAIARADGSAAINIEFGGTIGKPDLKGFLDLEIKLIRMASETLPKISDLKARLNFEEDKIQIDAFRGLVGGGDFKISGGAKFVSGAPLQLDFKLQSKKVLVKRDESLTVRVDTDVSLSGPVNAATVKGDIFVTQSRFLKDIDILPISMPGQPQPQVRSIPQPTRISFPSPPLRDWKFDVAIRTRENDTFLIRGNMARGEVAIALHLQGTGLDPYLVGDVELRDFRGSLPVGTLQIPSGHITFSQANPFEPILDLQGETNIQGYQITAHVSGTAYKPRLDLFSEPPLSQQDILSLLTTGTTAGEIGSNSEALAIKAAVLVLKNWYRKIFKRNPPSDGRDSNDWLERNFQVDVGSVDARTGRPEIVGSLKVSERVYMVGEIDMDGRVSGRVRYAIKFR